MDGMNQDGMNRRDFAGILAGLLAIAGHLRRRPRGRLLGKGLLLLGRGVQRRRQDRLRRGRDRRARCGS